MKQKTHRRVLLLTLVSLILTWSSADLRAAPPFDDLTPNEYTFAGRRGTSYTAAWDPSTYEMSISTPESRGSSVAPLQGDCSQNAAHHPG